ncbi:MAG: hypothetical protein WDZ82_03590 [Candidatus Paceibacterota bacterium]
MAVCGPKQCSYRRRVRRKYHSVSRYSSVNGHIADRNSWLKLVGGSDPGVAFAEIGDQDVRESVLFSDRLKGLQVCSCDVALSGGVITDPAVAKVQWFSVQLNVDISMDAQSLGRLGL